MNGKNTITNEKKAKRKSDPFKKSLTKRKSLQKDNYSIQNKLVKRNVYNWGESVNTTSKLKGNLV